MDEVETRVTINYLIFEKVDQHVKNLKQLSDTRFMADLSTSLPPWLIGLTVFGGMDPV